jgi:DNA-directed RNA polymerase specialized sigma24 family protein
MRQVTSQEVEQSLNNTDYIKIAKSIFKKYMTFKLTSDEKKEIFLDAIWYTLATWDESKSIFTTHLYNNIRFKILHFIKKNRKTHEKTNTSLHRIYAKEKVTSDDFDNLVAKLHESIKTPIIQKFVYGMSSTEIAEENGYNKNYANKLIKKGLKILKKSV